MSEKPELAGLGGDSSDWSGTKFDRTREIDFFGGPAPVSKADAGRGGGGPAGGDLGPTSRGDTVWALDGGAGGGLGFVASAPAFLFTHLLSSWS